MTNDRDFDYAESELFRIISDPGAEDRDKRIRYLLRLIYQAGARAQLDRGYHAQADPAGRVRWLAGKGMAAEDVKAVVLELEDLREKTAGLQGSYGVTDSDIRSVIGEGFHTAFRKAVDHPYATVIHKLIGDLPDEDWSAVIDFVSGPVTGMLRRAEAAAKSEGN